MKITIDINDVRNYGSVPKAIAKESTIVYPHTGQIKNKLLDDLKKWEILRSEESIVELICPNVEDAIFYPRIVAEMAQAVIEYHAHQSNKTEWKQLILMVQKAADILRHVDLKRFDEFDEQ